MDQDLVSRVQQGDERAFETLIVNDYSRLFRVAHGVLGDRGLAEDATQQAFVDIWRDIRGLHDPRHYEGWSYRLLVRVCTKEAKRQPRWQTTEELPADREPRATDPYGLVADRDQLERGFRLLSVDHRVVLVLRFLVGMTPDEVAETLGISRWTVYSRLERAIEAMRAALEAEARVTDVRPASQGALR
jgi:RNA polymerase sigma-70 factor (ECF subfamily)